MINFDKEIKFTKEAIEDFKKNKELVNLYKRKLELLEELKTIDNRINKIDEENGKELDEFYSNLERKGNL